MLTPPILNFFLLLLECYEVKIKLHRRNEKLPLHYTSKVPKLSSLQVWFDPQHTFLCSFWGFKMLFHDLPHSSPTPWMIISQNSVNLFQWAGSRDPSLPAPSLPFSLSHWNTIYQSCCLISHPSWHISEMASSEQQRSTTKKRTDKLTADAARSWKSRE